MSIDIKTLFDRMESMDGPEWEFNFKCGEFRWWHYQSGSNSPSAFESHKNGEGVASLITYLNIGEQ